MHFCQSFRLSKLLIGREYGSQKGITGREFGSQRHYRTGIGISKSLTGRESGHDMTKMHFSIFYSKLSDFSHMTH